MERITTVNSARVLILPGWQDSGAAHWQSRWERLYGYERVEQSDWLWPLRGDWMARLEEVVRMTQGPVVFVAHSLGCHLVAAWAAHSVLSAKSAHGALLVAPPDVERADAPANLHSWAPAVRQRLPFRSIALLSTDDPFTAIEPARALASQWGSETIELGALGHINADSDLGGWAWGHDRLLALCAVAPAREAVR